MHCGKRNRVAFRFIDHGNSISVNTGLKESIAIPRVACKPVSGAAGARRRLLGQGEKQHFGYAETMQGGLPRTADILSPLRRTGEVATYDLPALVSRPKPQAAVIQKITACLAEERAFGHDFLFVPVFIGCGAILWFSLDAAPSLPLLVVLFCSPPAWHSPPDIARPWQPRPAASSRCCCWVCFLPNSKRGGQGQWCWIRPSPPPYQVR
ncbi:hypothetical protein SY94_1288 [Agrobacterium tumefaciens]|nr:hypothetical protein SY94_1288 [Agrobacterium tumefaciens]